MPRLLMPNGIIHAYPHADESDAYFKSSASNHEDDAGLNQFYFLQGGDRSSDKAFKVNASKREAGVEG